MKFVIGLSTILLCMVTLSSAVLFWTSMPTDELGKTLAAITAIALEACKYAFFPAGVYYLKKRNYSGVGLLFIGAVLVVISVAATTGFLENAYTQQQHHTQQNSLEYQTKKQQLNSIQQQIDTLNALVAADAQGSYRTRAYENAEKVKILEQQRDKALAEIRDYRQTVQGNAQSIFSALSTPLGLSPDAVRQAAFTGLAVIVDICAIAALLALGGMGKEKLANRETTLPEPPVNIVPASVENAKVEQQPPQPPKPIFPTSLNTHEQEIARQILNGQYGDPPAVRRVINEGKVGHPVVKKIMDHLIEKNQVTRQGKQYSLVQAVIL